jgi:hypothetical protein
MPRRHHDRCRKVVTAAVAAVLFVVPFLATNAGSAGITQPVTVVTSVDGKPGTTATVGKQATVSFVVTNKATNGAKLGLFTIVVPKGVSGVGRADMSSTAWSELILPCGSTPRCSALVFASATRSSGYLAPGASLTVSIKLTPNAAGTLAFPMLGIGNGLFTVASTPTITVVPPAVQTSLRITSITDAGSPPLPILAAARAFKVAFEVVDPAGNVVTSPDVTVTLTALNLGPLAKLTALPVTTSNGTGVITATYLGPGINGLTLQLTSTSAGGPSSVVSSVNLATDGLTINAGPQGINITIGNIALSTGTATAILRNGVAGDLTFTIGPCVPGEPGLADCTIGGKPVISEVSLTGDLGRLYGTGVNGAATPAELDWSCNPSTCPAATPGSNETQQQAEFRQHPVDVAPSNGDGTFGKPVAAPPCSDNNETTGQISGKLAIGATFCVDVNAISRDDQGNLTIPALFENDPRFYMG